MIVAKRTPDQIDPDFMEEPLGNVGERKLWAHALLRAYLDYYIFEEKKKKRILEAEIFKHVRGVKRKRKEAVKDFEQIKEWFASNEMYVGSLVYICQALSQNNGDGLVLRMRHAITLPRGTIDSAYRFYREQNYLKNN